MSGEKNYRRFANAQTIILEGEDFEGAGGGGAVLEELDCLNVPDFTAIEQGFFWNVLRLTRQCVTV